MIGRPPLAVRVAVAGLVVLAAIYPVRTAPGPVNTPYSAVKRR